MTTADASSRQFRVPRFTSKITLRLHVGQISHSRFLAYPSPNEPPPMLRTVIVVSSRGHLTGCPSA